MERLPGQRRDGEPEVAAEPVAEPAPSPVGLDPGRLASLDAASVLALQRSAGNAAVSALMRSSRQREEPPRVRPQRSPALLLRSRLQAAGAPGGVLHRAVTTSGGEWDTDKYNLLKDVDGSGNAMPAAQNWRGVDIDLKFKPKDWVDAELIGLTQSVQAVVGGAPNLTPGAALRPIPAGDAQAINTGAGETDEGTAIDQSTTNTSPIYAVESATSTSLTDASDARFGENGWHYKDKANKVQHKDALLKDTPRRGNAEKNSRHIFETTALATKGAQAGTYYGSVRWGWRTDAAGNFTKIDLQKVSEGVPSSTFLKAAGVWNASKTAGGKDTVDLPIPDVKVTSAAVTLRPQVPRIDLPLPIGTRLQVIQDYTPPLLNGTVKVVDGPHHGLIGDIDGAEWPNVVDERA